MARAPITAPWTPEHIEKLKELVLKGKSLAALAIHFKRSREGIKAKLRKVGLPVPKSIRPPNVK